jgi:tungstate transport system substrate-binding protein
MNQSIAFAVLVVFATILGLSGSSAQVAAQNTHVRLALVNVPNDLLDPLLPDFEKQTGLQAEIVYTGNDPFGVARAGKADLVISHYGHEGVQPFVTAGFGLWPHPVFANQMVLLGPPNDPAQVRGLTDGAEAFRRIAASKSRFVVNDSAGAKYLEEILWTGAGVHEKGDWYLDAQVQGAQAVRDAAQNGAYVLWGLPPFLRLKRQASINLEPLVVRESILQRIMVAMVVNPMKVAGVNARGGEAFQKYLIAPATQAQIRAFRYPDFDQQAWWPAGRHNSARE